MDFLEAMNRIARDRTLATEFSENPEGVLLKMGVNTACLRIQRGTEPQQIPVTTCTSVGLVICGSVGTTSPAA